MKITCTFDDTTHKVVPIEPTEEMISAYVASEKMFNNSYGHICAAIAAAPPYPEDSPEHDMRNYVQSWSLKTKHIPLSDILFPLLAAPNGEE